MCDPIHALREPPDACREQPRGMRMAQGSQSPLLPEAEAMWGPFTL